MSHVKIHKHHFYTLIFSCILFIWVTLHQTLANNDLLTMWGATDKIQYENTYSKEVDILSEDELELNSAPAYSNNIREKKAMFKKKFNKHFSKKIDELSNEKLLKVADKIDSVLEKIENNDKMSQEKKEKIISQLLALLDIITEKIEYNEEFSLEIDLEELFSV